MTAAPAERLSVLAARPVWGRYPAVYEINTLVWLSELSRKYTRNINLSSVPAAEWDAIAAGGFDGVWLMGVWERSPAGIAVANRNDGLLKDFRRTLADFRIEDNVGSPYCVRRYVVDQRLGGTGSLAIARRELARRGLKLLLDFVPNHVAPDHPWVTDHPEYFIRGDAESLKSQPPSHIEVGGVVYACGRDPYFPPWPDVLQLNAFNAGLRKAVTSTIGDIAQQCDGIRCDMAMLFLNKIFARTWGSRAGARPPTEYWVDVISAIKKEHPGFLFVAEAYWDLEWELQQQGFDFCYDKRLYDRMESGDAEAIRLHLCADLAFQGKLVRFIENHDEPRAAATFSSAKQRALAVAIATLPGMKLFHEGQFEGRKVRLPVFLGRRPTEAADAELQGFYERLLRAVNRPVFHDGEWSLCDRSGWPDNSSFRNLLAWSWLAPDDRYLVVVNLSDHPAQAHVRVAWADAAGGSWQLHDVLSGATYIRDGDEMVSPGMYAELAPWSCHLFECRRTEKT